MGDKLLRKKAIAFEDNFGGKLSKLRERSGHTQQSLAKKLDIHVNTFQHYENGNTLPNIATAYKICCECNVTLDYFLPENEKSDTLLNRISKLNAEKAKLVEMYVDVLERI